MQRLFNGEKKNTVLVNLEKHIKKSMAYYRMNKVNMSKRKKEAQGITY